jgi:hypothetical protein
MYACPAYLPSHSTPCLHKKGSDAQVTVVYLSYQHCRKCWHKSLFNCLKAALLPLDNHSLASSQLVGLLTAFKLIHEVPQHTIFSRHLIVPSQNQIYLSALCSQIPYSSIQNLSVVFPVVPTLEHKASVKCFVSLHFLNPKTVGRTPWTRHQPVARLLPTYRTTETQNKCRQRDMPWVGFEPMIPVFEREKISHDLDRVATVISLFRILNSKQICQD